MMKQPDKAKTREKVKNLDELDRIVRNATTVTSGADVPPKTKKRSTKGRKARSGKSKPPAANMTRATFDLPNDFHERLKIAALREKRPMRELVQEALSSYLKRKRL